MIPAFDKMPGHTGCSHLLTIVNVADEYTPVQIKFLSLVSIYLSIYLHGYVEYIKDNNLVINWLPEITRYGISKRNRDIDMQSLAIGYKLFICF